MIPHQPPFKYLILLALGLSGCGWTTSTSAPANVSPAVASSSVERTADSGQHLKKNEGLCDVPSLSRARWAQGAATETPGFALTPAELTLLPGDAGWQLLGVEKRDGKEPIDLASATWKVEPSGIVEVDAQGYLRPVGTGKALVTAHLNGSSATTQVKVKGDSARPWDFAEDIMPVLTRGGCNSGGCHGKASGQNGFRLSIFAYDPVSDLTSIAREAAGRRISVFNPTQSLILLKGTGVVPHGGGPRFTPRSPEYQTLRNWITQGAPERSGPVHGKLERVEIQPPNVRLAGPGPLQIRVVATYADGHQRDVTRLATYRINDDSAARIDLNGHGELLKRAETDLVVRYQSMVVSTRLATVINPELSFDFQAQPSANFIDVELLKRLEALRVPPSPPASDSAFLRRVTLDLTGQQPSVEQVRQFQADPDPEKRLKRVDELLADRDFVRFWRIKFGDLLQISQARQGPGANYYQAWIDEQLTKNTPWDEVVRSLLTAVGKPEEYGGGPVNYALDALTPNEMAEQTAQRFMGIRLRCAQCHDHPFDRWTQDDYFGIAACFAKVRRGGGGGMMGRTTVRIDPSGSVEHLRTRQKAEPRLLDGTPVEVAPDEDPRKALAEWMTNPSNPYFARATANWVWAQFFGKGLVEPADDLSQSNRPVHPELLDALAAHFIAHQFDLRDLVRTVATSRAYGASSAAIPGNEHDTRLFSHQLPRPLSAYQLADAIAKVTDVVNRYPNRPSGTRAIDVADPTTASTILDTLGRCARVTGCSTSSTPALSLRQALLLIGGDVVESKITHLNGYLANLLELEPEADEIVENLYYRTLCRAPTQEETDYWVGEFSRAENRREVSEDLFWALLESREFAFNH